MDPEKQAMLSELEAARRRANKQQNKLVRYPPSLYLLSQHSPSYLPPNPFLNLTRPDNFPPSLPKPHVSPIGKSLAVCLVPIQTNYLQVKVQELLEQAKTSNSDSISVGAIIFQIQIIGTATINPTTIYPATIYPTTIYPTTITY